MIRICKYSPLEVHDTETSSSMEDRPWSMSKSMDSMPKQVACSSVH